MSTNPQEAQAQAQAHQLQMQQLQAQKVMSGIRTGIDLLEDKNVAAPIIMHEGLTNLKWILQGLLAGQFSLNLDAQGRAAAPGKPQTSRPLADYAEDDGEGKDEGTSGANGKSAE